MKYDLRLEISSNLSVNVPESINEIFKNVNFDFGHEEKGSYNDSSIVKKGENLRCKFSSCTGKFGFVLSKYDTDTKLSCSTENLIMDCKYHRDYKEVGEIEEVICYIPTVDGSNFIEIMKKSDKKYLMHCYYYGNDVIEILEKHGKYNNKTNLKDSAQKCGIVPDKERVVDISKNKIPSMLCRIIDNPLDISNDLIDGKNGYQKVLNIFKQS